MNYHLFKKKLASIFASKKTDNKAFEFSPTYLRIQKQAPTNFSRLIGWGVVLFVIAVLLWAYFSHIAIYANTTGKLIVSGKSQKIQPLNAGKIEKIYVKEGQVVQKGDLLVQLSDVDAKTNIANLEAKLSFYRQNQQNFKYIFPIIEQIEQDENTQNTTPIGTLRNKQATLDLEEFFKQVAQFNAKIENLRKASNNLKKEIKLEQSMLKNARKRVDMFSRFFDNQDISELQFNFLLLFSN
jgi:multidrug efflux pump subunit AcrA (membrane-fusion protein)